MLPIWIKLILILILHCNVIEWDYNISYRDEHTHLHTHTLTYTQLQHTHTHTLANPPIRTLPLCHRCNVSVVRAKLAKSDFPPQIRKRPSFISTSQLCGIHQSKPWTHKPTIQPKQTKCRATCRPSWFGRGRIGTPEKEPCQEGFEPWRLRTGR